MVFANLADHALEYLHCEMNAWKQLLYLIYIEYVQREKFDDFVNILGAPVVKCTSPNTAAEQEVAWSTDDLLPFKQSAGNQDTMAGDDPPRNTETRQCDKTSQTGHGMQSEEETNDAPTEEPGSKSEVMQAFLHIENKILCMFANISFVLDKF